MPRWVLRLIDINEKTKFPTKAPKNTDDSATSLIDLLSQ